ncbi:serine hydrolase domain-containing protein [Fredinandcohnia humi]
MHNEMFQKLEKKLKSCKIEGFVIHQGNERMFEYYKNKKVQEKPSKVYSVTKSIVSLLIGKLIELGLLENIHKPIFHYFPEIVNQHDSKKNEISIFHLLTMTSGLKVVHFQGSKNWIKTIVEQPLVYTPGSTYQYNSGDSHLLSAIIHRVSGKTTAAFADEHLFGPLGIKKYSWVTDPQGIHGGGFSLFMNTEDMLKVGHLYLNGGRVKSRQIILSDWISQSTESYKVLETKENGSFGYGYQLWTFRSNHEKNPIDYFYANGIYGQFIFVVPTLNWVVVVKSQLQSEDQLLPMRYVEDLIQFQKNHI